MKKLKLLILVLLILVIPMIFVMISSKSYTDEKNYLSKNNKSINLDDIDDFSGMDLLKDDLKDKKIIFTGEDHTLDKDNLFKIKMIKYLQKEIGLKYCLDEIGYSDAYFMNKYLETGDESILKKFFDHITGTAMYNVDDYNTYKQIYEFNQTLPKEDRIKVVGIDIEHSGMSVYDYIIDIIKNKDLKTEPLNTLLEDLKKYYAGEISPINLRGTNQELEKDLYKDEEVYEDIFKENIDDFKYILNNIEAMCVSYSSEPKDWNNVRDNYIYENFKSIDSKLDNAKYFGQWGGAHIYKDIVRDEQFGVDTKFLGAQLNEDKDYKGKVLSIQYGYYNKGGVSRSMSYIDTKLFSDYLEKDEDAILFKLNSKKSPFNNSGVYPLEYKVNIENNKVTTDYFDYMILIKDSKESKRL